MTRKLLVILTCLFVFYVAFGNKRTIEQIVAVVGNKIILQSDVEIGYLQYLEQAKLNQTDITKCDVFEELLLQKLLLYQAELDSLTITDEEVNTELDKRINYLALQYGSVEKMEEVQGKTILQIKNEFFSLIKEQKMIESKRAEVIGGTKVTPAEVQDYYNSLGDSVPLINSEIELAQIVVKTPISDKEKKATKEKLEEIRKRIINGESFSTLAILYSEDPASAKKGGELGFLSRADLVPEFSAVAFELKKGEVSKIVETEFGFHIIQLIEKKGQLANFRHILLTPKVSTTDHIKARELLDSIVTLINKKELTFAEAAEKYSTDKNTKYNGGVIMNPSTGSTRFEMSEVDPAVFFVIDKLKPGEISVPVFLQIFDTQKAYRVLQLKLRTEPHKANLKDDYQRLQAAALARKQSEKLKAWLNQKKQNTYIKIHKDFESCNIFEE